MADTNKLKIITDETLMEKRTHGQSAFPFQYYLEDIWDFDFHTIGWHWHQEIEFMYVCKSQYKNVGLGQYKNVGFPTFLYCLFSLHLL